MIRRHGRRLLTLLLSLAIRLYQLLLSPWLGSNCRFHPSCSVYALEALEEHGPWQGSLLAMRRLGRCHPLNAGGVDLVPERDPNGP